MKAKASVEKRAVSGAMAGVANFLSIVIQNLLLVPVFLAHWGRERYGIWLTLLATQAIFQTINSAHQGYVGNEINRSIHADDKAECARVLGSSLFVALCLGVIQVVTITVLYNVGWLTRLLGCEKEPRADAAFISLIIFWLLTGPLQGLLGKAYAPLGHYARGTWWGVLQRLAQSLVLIACIVQGTNILGVAIAYSAAGCLTDLGLLIDVRYLLRRAGFWRATLDWRVGLRDFSRSLVICGKDLIEQSGNNGLILLIGHMLGMSVIPLFTTLRTLSNTAMQATSILLQPVATDLIRLHVKRRGADIAEALAVAWFFMGILVNLSIVIVLPLIPWIYDTWVRHKIGFNETVFLLLMWTVVLKNFGAPLTMYLVNNNRLLFMTVSAIARNLATIAIAIATIKAVGIIGIALALVIAELAASVWLPLRFGARELASIQGRLADGALRLAAVEQGVWLLLILLAVMEPAHLVAICAACAIGILGISLMRWRELSPRSTARIWALVRAN